MEEVLIDLAIKGGPGAVSLLIAYLWLNPKINRMQSDLTELKNGKRWTETCEKTHEEVNHRLARIEAALNGRMEK